ncbi:unnamed protein product [Toxocara canis]|uniref:RRM domain-containing protein n=1 Tax=Toxocara canis TaxID=6265 RepID=A0A183UAJ6_TOXCA|nr:unnamed protein product [Toxocara canis]
MGYAAEQCWEKMLSPALTTVAFDGAGNPYQVVYPCAPAYNSTALPLGVPDACAFELIPHRIFVGGFASATTESELRSIFERFGHVREAKVIRNGEGTPKGYGFVTFDSEEEAKAVIIRAEKEKLEFRGRRLNLGPAVRRTLRGPRFSQEYTLSTPTGQILPANGFGGFSYSYPQQSPYVVMSPTPTTPSFVFTPLPSTPSVFVYPYGASVSLTSFGPMHFICSFHCVAPKDVDASKKVATMSFCCVNSEMFRPDTHVEIWLSEVFCALNKVLHMPSLQEHEDSQTQRQALTANAESVMPAASAAATVDQDPINQTTDAYPVAVCATPQMQQSPGSYCITPSASLISIAQPLTPVTPSVISQQMCGYPSGGAYYVPPGVQNIDMTHYSQMTPPVSVSCYFPPPNTFHFVSLLGYSPFA